MAWVNVEGHRYYRRSKRVGGRVVTEHVGRGHLANLDAEYDAAKRNLDEQERLADRVGMRSDGAEFAAYFEFDDVLAAVVTALAHRQGMHRPKRQVSQSCGDNALVCRATHRYANVLRDGLGWDGADALERPAIVRVINNWLAVGVLEAKANRVEPGHASRAVIEKSLSQADRRLMQAMRTLAALRGVKPCDVFAQLPGPSLPPVAAGG